MTNYTVGDVFLTVDDLYVNKIGLIRDTFAFKLYDPTLQEKRAALSSIRKGLGETPLVKALKNAEGRHDSGARTLHAITTGLAHFVLLPEETRLFFDNIRKTLIPNLGIIKETYRGKAAAAKSKLKDLGAMKSALEAFAIGPDMSLYTLAATYLEAGKEIDSLLSSRAETVVDDELKRTKDIKVLRSQTIGLINRFREALAQEIIVNPSLPRDLEARVFSYYDQLGEPRVDHTPEPETEEEVENPTVPTGPSRPTLHS